MRIGLALTALAAVISMQAVVPAAAFAQDHRDDSYRDDRSNRDDRANRDDRSYRDDRGDQNRGYDRNHHYNARDRRYQDCRRSNGTTGTIAGAVGGGVIGNVVGGGTLGTLAGAGGGALLGRHIDQKHDQAQNRRNGC